MHIQHTGFVPDILQAYPSFCNRVAILKSVRWAWPRLKTEIYEFNSMWVFDVASSSTSFMHWSVHLFDVPQLHSRLCTCTNVPSYMYMIGSSMCNHTVCFCFVLFYFILIWWLCVYVIFILAILAILSNKRKIKYLDSLLLCTKIVRMSTNEIEFIKLNMHGWMHINQIQRWLNLNIDFSFKRFCW